MTDLTPTITRLREETRNAATLLRRQSGEYPPNREERLSIAATLTAVDHLLDALEGKTEENEQLRAEAEEVRQVREILASMSRDALERKPSSANERVGNLLIALAEANAKLLNQFANDLAEVLS